MPFSHITHHMGKIPGSDLSKLVRTTPIVRLKQLEDSVYLQGGQVFSEDGQTRELPGWAYAQMGRLTPEALAEAGFKEVPKPPTDVKVEEAKVEAPVMWQCPACQKVMDERSKEAHIARHNMRLGPNEQLDADGKPKH